MGPQPRCSRALNRDRRERRSDVTARHARAWPKIRDGGGSERQPQHAGFILRGRAAHFQERARRPEIIGGRTRRVSARQIIACGSSRGNAARNESRLLASSKRAASGMCGGKRLAGLYGQVTKRPEKGRDMTRFVQSYRSRGSGVGSWPGRAWWRVKEGFNGTNAIRAVSDFARAGGPSVAVARRPQANPGATAE